MKKAGFTTVGFVAFVFVFIIVTCITAEYYHIFTVKEMVETDVSRALNISVDTAMYDISRMQHKSVMNTSTAEQEFKSYLINNVGLNNNYEKYDNHGNFQYQLIIDNTSIQRSPAKYTVSGRIKMQPITMRGILPARFEIPFSQSSKNTRYDD